MKTTPSNRRLLAAGGYMDFATFNGLYTLFLIIIFVALIFWAYSKKHKQTFDEISNSILTDDLDSTQYESPPSKHTGAKK